MQWMSNPPMMVLVSFIISLIMGKIFLPFLKKLEVGQSIREDGPQSHLSKEGTPTIGGIIFLSALLIGLVIFGAFNLEVLILLIGTLSFGLVGFIDDYIKVMQKRNLGFTAAQKALAQVIISIVLIALIHYTSGVSTDILLPFSKRMVNFGILTIPFFIFVIVGTVNSVNLTDGLDGLSSSVTIVVLVFFALVSYKMNRPYIMMFCLILAGALLGFFWYNKYPAKVFMGDTGSLALGGAVVSIAMLLNLTLILPIACGIYFIETLSVIIQVTSFKLTGKRVFLMSPLHHHFEQLGYSETKIVTIFLITEIILCVISYFILF